MYAATPFITSHPESRVVKEGSKGVSLECLADAYGLGNIQYRWRKYTNAKDQWVKSSSRRLSISSTKLNFKMIKKEYEGTYYCVAMNDDGEVISNNATITVYGMFHFVRHIYSNTVTSALLIRKN